ncbi:methyl-accepting chemotaxis protein [Aquabacterium sp. J223]|uniref:methyl-accepting chemotaxis protein n=1 Tax=Aquabacterium sp. J223 TaxID=2898431 RepID=UPI0021AE1C7E|nr:methyl-accepting chemotaxis protein [Aquabacterium sp. J223]UUX94243.1 methyl-accepting chemotaxis protein [Aquabacterium sp. J223]
MTRWMRPLSLLERLPVGRQLVLAFACVLLLAAALGAEALVGLRTVNERAALLSDKWLKGVGALSDARAHLLETRDLEVRHSRTADSSYHAEYEDKMAEVEKTVAALLKDQAAQAGSAEEGEIVATLSKQWAGYRQAQLRVVKLGRDKQQQDAADIADGASGMAFEEVQGALGKLLQFNYDGGAAAAEAVRGVYQKVQLVVAATLLCALGLGGGLAWTITRSLLRQLGGEPRRATAVARAVAEGRLDTPVALRAGDESSLLAHLQGMQARLATAVGEVRRGAEQVALASGEIARGNDDLSGRTEHQAQELRQTSATMEQLGEAVRTSAGNADQARQLAEQATGVAEEGGEVVGRVVQTMKGIDESSRRIAEIIGVIDGIAFQTNILALNAAVEAARAGEQGRGFAVVASEVRSLAQRSADAAKEIKSLIQASVERVGEGSQLVTRAGETMQKVVTSIQDVSRIVAQISQASAEQRDGMAELAQAVSRIDTMTQQNAALVEQSSAAAGSLSEQSRQLVSAVAVFRT